MRPAPGPRSLLSSEAALLPQEAQFFCREEVRCSFAPRFRMKFYLGAMKVSSLRLLKMELVDQRP